MYEEKLYATAPKIVLFAVVIVPCAVHAQSCADEAAVRNLPQQLAAAWAKHSGRELAKILSEDVDFVNVGGDWIHGRKDFELYHSPLRSGRFKESIATPLQTAVRFLRPDLCVVHWTWKIEGDKNEDLTPRKSRYGIFTMIAEKPASSASWFRRG
ncbi:MAG: SgcJ/EcaC family oxidoreductase [Acidobacteria bacterium]|nr:SgcJ/EcaC family oxidoreductase [Acidobacteriota bacterium]